MITGLLSLVERVYRCTIIGLLWYSFSGVCMESVDDNRMSSCSSKRAGVCRITVHDNWLVIIFC